MFILSHITAFEYWRQAKAFPSRRMDLADSPDGHDLKSYRTALPGYRNSYLEDFAMFLSPRKDGWRRAWKKSGRLQGKLRLIRQFASTPPCPE